MAFEECQQGRANAFHSQPNALGAFLLCFQCAHNGNKKKKGAKGFLFLYFSLSLSGFIFFFVLYCTWFRVYLCVRPTAFQIVCWAKSKSNSIVIHIRRELWPAASMHSPAVLTIGGFGMSTVVSSLCTGKLSGRNGPVFIHATPKQLPIHPVYTLWLGLFSHPRSTEHKRAEKKKNKIKSSGVIFLTDVRKSTDFLLDQLDPFKAGPSRRLFPTVRACI